MGFYILRGVYMFDNEEKEERELAEKKDQLAREKKEKERAEKEEAAKEKVKIRDGGEVYAYLHGTQISTGLVGLALRDKKTLDEVKKELRQAFPDVEFKVESK